MSTSVDMSTLIRFLLHNGWDYTRLPPALQHVTRRQMQRVWHKRSLPEYARALDDVCRALLEADPPLPCKRRRIAATDGVTLPPGSPLEQSMDTDEGGAEQ